MPRTGETPYSPGALRAWARYMSRIGRDDLAAQLNAQADAAEQMQPVGSAFDTWLGGYGSRLGWNPQAAAPAARPQVSGNYLGNLGTWRPSPAPGAPYGYQAVGYRTPQVGYPAGGIPQAANPAYPAPYAGWMGATPLGETPMLQTLLAQRAARAGGGGGLGEGWGTPKWNPWTSFTTGTQPGWYSANSDTGYVNFAGKTLAGAQADIAGNFPEGSRLFYGSPTYGYSPAPMVRSRGKMRYKVGKGKVSDFLKRQYGEQPTTQMSAPLPMAATGPAGVGLVYGNANWGRP